MYSTYVMGKDAILGFNVPSKLDTTGMEKMKTKKLTIKQQLKYVNDALAEKDDTIQSLRLQMADQNRLLERVRVEGNQLIEKYNKLAGKYNAIRSLVTNDD